MERERLCFLDFLKFMASICIACMLHYHEHLLPSYGIEFPFTENKFFYYWTTHEWIFVEMFFIISGLLFYQVYLPKIKSGHYSFQYFFSGRALRLWPLVIITSLYMYVLQFILERVTGTVWSNAGTLSLWTLFRDMIFCGGMYGCLNAPIWYLNVLLVCYIIAYVAAKISEKCKGAYFVYAIPLIFGVGIKMTNAQGFIANVTASRGYICFFLGIILGFFFSYSDKLAEKKKRILTGICIVELIIMVFLQLHRIMIIMQLVITIYLHLLCFSLSCYMCAIIGMD